MESFYHQDSPGRDFDEFLDWNGNAGGTNSTTQGRIAGSAQITSLSPPNSSPDGSAASKDAAFGYHTADLPTPSNSSGSPDMPCLPEPRFSNDIVRENVPIAIARPLLKRKVSPQEFSLMSNPQDSSHPPAKKRPHNVIEKRYRANLNGKIAELRDSVPSLRLLKKTQAGEDGAGTDNEELDGLAPTNKLNKASVLTKAVEYIRHLELRNKRLEDENKLLKERLQTLDKVLAHGGDGAQRATAFTTDSLIEKNAALSSIAKDSPQPESQQTERHPPQGLIPVPREMRRLREAQSQEHYGHIYDTRPEDSTAGRKWPVKLLLGSIASLMIMEGFSEEDSGTKSREKGLFGIPLELLDGYQFLQSPRIYLAAFSHFSRTGGAFPLIKGFAALTILAFIIFTYLFNSKPSSSIPGEAERKPMMLQEAPSLASPIEVRRRAWSTSMQTLGLPHHSFFPEWLAVTSEWLKYTIGCLLGLQAYSWVTGRSEDDEVARIKAWDIAIDAQLAGGDPEVSRSRVVLTSFGSGTLPRSSLRLMLKALHCRVLLWRVGRPGSISSQATNRLGRHLANREWSRARQLNSELKSKDAEELPGNLSTLVEQGCDDVLTDAVVQRAYNLMYDRSTSEYAGPKDSLLDVIVEDHAVRSPLDAVAAWSSSERLCQALEISLQPSPSGLNLNGAVEIQLQSALDASPPGSSAETRALALHAVFFSKQRHNCYLRALNALPQTYDSSGTQTPRSGERGPYFIDSSTPASACASIRIVLHCAMTMGILESQQADGQTDEASAYFCSSSFKPEDLDLLSFGALYFVLLQFWKIDQSTVPATFASTIRLLCSWLHSEASNTSNIPSEAVESIDHMCFLSTGASCKRRQSMVSNDTGYESWEERDAQSSADRKEAGIGLHVSWV